MRNVLLGLVATAAVAAPLVLAAASAQADPGSPGCATRAEYSKVKKGMSPERVARIFGTNGKVSYSCIGTSVFSLSREYKPCQPYTEWSHVEVDFDKNRRSAPWKVDGKSSWWIS